MPASKASPRATEPSVEATERDRASSVQAAPTPAEASPLPAGPGPAVESPAITAPEEATTAPPLADESKGVPLWAMVLAGVAALAAGAVIAFRRKRRDTVEPAFEPPILPEVAPVRPTPVPVVPTAVAAPLVLDISVARMSASLVNATLSYRLSLGTSAALSRIEVRGDMISAHASRPAEEQLGLGEAQVLHRLPGLAAGETIELGGEVRLPLAAITPIRHGSAVLFVPLVRFEVMALDGDRPVKLRAAFVVGLEEMAAGERLQPFRLDLGPRVYPKVGRRELTVPAFA
ncbi:MAG: hypothetical protein ACK4Z8_07245 [Novosphingobium sp.]